MEEQTSANAEELGAPNTESPAAIGPDNSAASEEAAKKGGRTLKLKGAESEASEDKPTEAPAQTAPEGETNTDEGAPQGRARRGRQRRPRRDPNTPSANPMSLTELKARVHSALLAALTLAPKEYGGNLTSFYKPLSSAPTRRSPGRS